MENVSEEKRGDLMAELGLSGIVSAELEKRIIKQVNAQIEKDQSVPKQMPYTLHKYERAVLKLN